MPLQLRWRVVHVSSSASSRTHIPRKNARCENWNLSWTPRSPQWSFRPARISDYVKGVIESSIYIFPLFSSGFIAYIGSVDIVDLDASFSHLAARTPLSYTPLHARGACGTGYRRSPVHPVQERVVDWERCVVLVEDSGGRPLDAHGTDGKTSGLAVWGSDYFHVVLQRKQTNWSTSFWTAFGPEITCKHVK